MTDDHALDTCECGDYREDHKDGHGICIFSANARVGDGHFGAGKCEKFRLARRHIPTDHEPRERDK